MNKNSFLKIMENLYNQSGGDREYVVCTDKRGMVRFDNTMKRTMYEWQRKELWKKREDVFRNYDVTVEEFRSLGEMIRSEDPENLRLAGLLIDELYKRPRLYPQWSR